MRHEHHLKSLPRINQLNFASISLPISKREAKSRRAPLTVMNSSSMPGMENSSGFQVIGDLSQPMIENFQDTSIAEIDLSNLVMAPPFPSPITISPMREFPPEIGITVDPK